MESPSPPPKKKKKHSSIFICFSDNKKCIQDTVSPLQMFQALVCASDAIKSNRFQLHDFNFEGFRANIRVVLFTWQNEGRHMNRIIIELVWPKPTTVEGFSPTKQETAGSSGRHFPQRNHGNTNFNSQLLLAGHKSCQPSDE